MAGAAAPQVQHPSSGGRRSEVAARVQRLTRDSAWTQVAAVPMKFETHHPQGMVKIGETLFVSSVEVTARTKRFDKPIGGVDRDAGEGVGHLFKIDRTGSLVADLVLGEGAMYHPGGIDYDGTSIWVPVAEYRPNSRSIIYKIDPRTMTATPVLRFADHIGGVVRDTDSNTLHGVSWGSRRFYRWTLDKTGRVTNGHATPESLRRINPSHYLDYQDCKYGGGGRMVCTGVTEMRPGPSAPAFRLGGVEIVDLRAGRPIFQAPILLWTASGLDMTHNPVWFEPSPAGLRAYFMPEDNASTLYVYEVGDSQP
jgi:Family of unknown function (DUF6454)